MEGWNVTPGPISRPLVRPTPPSVFPSFHHSILPPSCHSALYAPITLIPMPRRGKKRRRTDARRARSGELIDAEVEITWIVRGMTVEEALRNLRNRIPTAARAEPGAVVEIITGKGQNSPGGVSRLGPAVKRLLEGEMRNYLKDFCGNSEQSGFVVRLIG